MPQYVPINNQTDVIVDTTKVTAGYFTGGVGSLAVDNLTTSSLSTTQKGYYYNLQYSSEDQLSVSYGHIEGSGSGAANETKAIYNQFKVLLLDPEDLASTASNGFKFAGANPTTGSVDGISNTSDYEDNMYFIVAERARMKDRWNKKNWTLKLSGSKSSGVNDGSEFAVSGSTVTLTDDSATVAATATPVGPRYNIISGSDGTAVHASSSVYFGYFYPHVGIMALRGNMLSSSEYGIPGLVGSVNSSSFMDISGTNGNGTGLAPELTTDGTADNALKLAQAIHQGAQAFRSEEDQTSKAYFCRAMANDFNFSNNPTFVSGSDKQLRHSDMIGYPHSFISTVGLYQGAGGGTMELVAVGRLSSPVQKNYGTEATIKVKLTY